MASGSAKPLSTGLLIRASTLAVSIGSSGTTAYLVRSVKLNSNGIPSQAEIELAGSRAGAAFSVPPNTPVSITLNEAGGVKTKIFAGRVMQRYGDYDKSGEAASLIAVDVCEDFRRDFISGQLRKVVSADGKGTMSIEVVDTHPCVFNADGKGNYESLSLDEGGGDTASAVSEAGFHGDPRRAWSKTEDGADAVPGGLYEWTVGRMILYVYERRKHGTRYDFRPPAGPAVVNAVGDPLAGSPLHTQPGMSLVVFGVDVEGKTMLEAIRTICAAANLFFWFRPAKTGTGVKSHLITYPRSYDEAGLNGTVKKTLYMPKVEEGTLPLDRKELKNPGLDTLLNRTRIDHARLAFKEDYTGVVTRVVAKGAPIRVQAELLLYPLWRTLDEADVLGGPDGGPPPVFLKAEHERKKLIRRKIKEARSPNWNPKEEDPKEAYYKDVGRLFGADMTGYERGKTGDVWPWTTNSLVGGPPIGPDLGFFSTAPRPFHRFLDDAPSLGDDGAALFHAHQKLKAAKLTLYHANIDAGATAREFTGSWEFDAERSAIRITEPSITTLPSFAYKDATGLLPPSFALAAQLIVSIEADFRLHGSSGAPGGLFDAYAIMRAEAEYHNTGIDRAAADRLAKVAGARLKAASVPAASVSFVVPWLDAAWEPGYWCTGVGGRGIRFIGQVKSVEFNGIEQTTTVHLEDETLMFRLPHLDLTGPMTGAAPMQQ